MVDFIRNLIGNDILSTIVMSAVPMIELKGGIVFARGIGLDFSFALLYAFIGSGAVFFIVYFLLRPILNLMKKIKGVDKFARKVEHYFSSKAEEAMAKQKRLDKRGKDKSENLIKGLGVFIFVAIPLPLTGVWAGSAIAVFLDLKMKDAILPVFGGNLVAGLIISVLAEIFIRIDIRILDYVLYAMFGIALILMVITIIKLVKSKPKEEVSEQKSDDEK